MGLSVSQCCSQRQLTNCCSDRKVARALTGGHQSASSFSSAIALPSSRVSASAVIDYDEHERTVAALAGDSWLTPASSASKDGVAARRSCPCNVPSLPPQSRVLENTPAGGVEEEDHPVETPVLLKESPRVHSDADIVTEDELSPRGADDSVAKWYSEGTENQQVDASPTSKRASSLSTWYLDGHQPPSALTPTTELHRMSVGGAFLEGGPHRDSLSRGVSLCSTAKDRRSLQTTPRAECRGTGETTANVSSVAKVLAPEQEGQ